MNIEILNEERLRYWCAQIEIQEEAVSELVQMIHLVENDPFLRTFLDEFHEKTAIRGEWHRDWSPLAYDPQVQAVLGERTSMFYLLAYLAAVPFTAQEYRRRGIGMDVFHDSLLDFPNYMGDYFRDHGQWGYSQFMWIWNHLTLNLFRLGRLQYILTTLESKMTAFRRKADRRILLLADPEIELRADGCALGSGALPPQFQAETARDYPAMANLFSKSSMDQPETGWLPEFRELPDGWQGNPVSPYGNVLNTTVMLSKADWDLVLQHGDQLLDIHIPRKNPLTVETCSASLRQALDFFECQIPDHPPKVFFCHTWFFTPQLQQILPAESNIVRFQREFYLHPHPGSPGFLWSYVFGEKVRDPASAPRDTSLQRAVLEWLTKGGELFDLPGLLFHDPEDWGSQPYMHAWDLAGLDCGPGSDVTV
jgi:hypothetical protein